MFSNKYVRQTLGVLLAFVFSAAVWKILSLSYITMFNDLAEIMGWLAFLWALYNLAVMERKYKREDLQFYRRVMEKSAS